MTHRVVQIWGIGYSGSSILNLLLDSLKSVRSLGEANHIWDGRSRGWPCSLCQKSDNDAARDCRFWDGINPAIFYSEAFSRYPDAQVLVDATKIPEPLLERQRRERWFEYFRLMLVKHPHEFAASHCRHDGGSVENAFWGWIRFTANCLQFEMPTLNLSYQTLMGRAGALQGIAQSIGVGGDARRQNWWESDSHIIGGNTAVRAQVNTHYSYYLDVTPKYAGRRGALFVDEAWKQDSTLCRNSIECYNRFQGQLEPLLAKLELPPVAEMIEECHDALRAAEAIRFPDCSLPVNDASPREIRDHGHTERYQ